MTRRARPHPPPSASRGLNASVSRRERAPFLHVHTAGPVHPTGPPVLLVPGLAVSARYLLPTAAALEPYRHVLAADPPGTGRSGHGPVPASVAQLADLLATLLCDAEGPADVVANSFGCAVAIELARRHPDAVRRLVLTSPVLAPGMRGPVSAAAHLLRSMTSEPWRYVVLVLADLSRVWPPAGWAQLRAQLRYPVLARIGGVAVPVLVVRGRRDPLLSARFAVRLARAAPRGTMVELDAPHALPYDAPHELARLVLAG